ncbi:MAG: ferredoxin [Myxococcales bacterium]|nr:ferredoxin [Myxococcales bacterium]
MPNKYTIGEEKDYPNGSITPLEIAGQDYVVVRAEDGSLSVLRDECSHLQLPICEGHVTENRLVCPWHGASFDISTGAALTLPADEPIPCLRHELTDGKLIVHLEE